MTIAESLRELARFHDRAREQALTESGGVTPDASYHANLSDAAARAAAHFDQLNQKPTA